MQRTKVSRSVRPVSNRWMPELWASLKPFGLGEQHSNNFWEVFRAAWENRDQLPYAYRILNHGVCDGCSLGTSGMTDWTMNSIHLCNIRLRLLRLNTMPPLDDKILSDGDRVRLLNDFGTYEGEVLIADVAAGTIEIHWPEGNVLVKSKSALTPGKDPGLQGVLGFGGVSKANWRAGAGGREVGAGRAQVGAGLKPMIL